MVTSPELEPSAATFAPTAVAVETAATVLDVVIAEVLVTAVAVEITTPAEVETKLSVATIVIIVVYS